MLAKVPNFVTCSELVVLMKNVLQRAKRYLNLYSLFGFVFLIVGIIGIFLPLLPTTPFLLLASFFFSKGNPDFHQWLLANKILGPPIRDWNNRGAIRIKVKITATALMGLSGLYVFYKPTIPVLAKLMMLVLFFAVLLFIWTRPNE